MCQTGTAKSLLLEQKLYIHSYLFKIAKKNPFDAVLGGDF